MYNCSLAKLFHFDSKKSFDFTFFFHLVFHIFLILLLNIFIRTPHSTHHGNPIPSICNFVIVFIIYTIENAILIAYG